MASSAGAALRVLGLWSLGVRCCSGAEGFRPFAGLDELRPRPLADFCGQEEATATEGGQRLRWCQHSVRRTLEDHGEVELGWRMRVDPDAVLSLDTEAANAGAKALSCGPGFLEIELPRPRAERLAPGHLVLGSRFAHRCRHLDGEHLYGRVREVRRSPAAGDGASRVRLAVEELPSFAHAVPSLAFHFSYMPAEAQNVVKYPEMQTDFGTNREFLEKKRRLTDGPFFDKLMDKLKGLAHSKGVEEDDGGFEHGAKDHTTVSSKNNLLNFMPKKLSNFGWNWNFFMNTTESPNYDIKLPGAEGMVKVRHPYIKMHAGIYLNFSSEFAGITTAPKVQWTAGVRGHGYFQARVLASMNTTASAKVDPFATKTFQLPMLESLSAPQWFQKMDMALGSVPVSMEPGFQFNARMYHSGTFHGAMAVGGKTHGVFNPTLSYDSLKGFDVKMQAQLYDTDIWPPFWMIFTKRFELGVIFQPSILMRGDFAGLKKSTVAIDMHPYLNITISREQENETAAEEEEPGVAAGERQRRQRAPALPPAAALPAARPAVDDGSRALTVYPLRVVGLNGTDGPRRFKVRVDVGGRTLETGPQMSWGQVSFHDHISQFSVGRISEKVAVAEPFVVTLVEVDESPTTDVTKVLGWAEVRCEAFEDGRCSPSPAVAHIRKGGAEVAAVELAVLWDDKPELWLASQLHGAVVEFPEVVLRKGALFSEAPADGDEQPLTLRFRHGGISYAAPLGESGNASLPTFNSTAAIELGPRFLQDWLPCSNDVYEKCEPTRVELYLGATQVAAADVPHIDWSSQLERGRQDGSFLAASSAKLLTAPILLPLYEIGGEGASVAVVKMKVNARSPVSSALFLKPTAGVRMPLGGFPQNFVWTIGDVARDKIYSFKITVLRKPGAEAASAGPPADSLLPSVQGQALVPVHGGGYEVHLQCRQQEVDGLPAEEAPCSFAQALAFGAQHTPGEQVAVLLRWEQDGLRHELLSPPFEIVAPPPGGVPRRLWSPDAWNARVSSHKSCARKDLHFRLGAGMLVRGRIDRLGLPEDMPALGNLGDQQPTMSTGYRKVAAVKPGTDARDLLPEEVCAGGLCKGALPGCTEASFEKKHWPVIKFNFNRRFHYSAKTKGKFHGLMKEALAYAFSATPEALAVILSKINQTDSKEIVTTTLPSAFRAAEAGMMEQHSNAPANPASYVPIAGPSTSTTKVPFYKRWWDGTQRRLQGQRVDGEAAAEAQLKALGGAGNAEGEQKEHQVTVHFKQGVPFVIDRPLVNMMLQHGYFMEVEDDASQEQGPLHVTDFHIEGGGEATEEGERLEAAAGADPSASQSGAGALAGSLGVLALLATAALLQRQRRPRRYQAAAAALAEEKGAE